jgi:tRNA nucleotidyltransferase (CCA-adding enzyme)
MNITLSEELNPIINALIAKDITPVLVGGYLRDKFFKNTHSKDIDIELYNTKSLNQVIDILKVFAKPYEVGKSFGVIKLSYNSYEIDFSLPRTESKTGRGHRGFKIETHKNISFKEAAKRRDFTINAMGYNLQNNSLLDPYNGLNDIQNKILVYVNKKSFTEDPLRVFRAIGFAARFELTCKDELIQLCQSMYENGSLYQLPKERIFEELKKLLLRSDKPSIGFLLLEKMKSLAFFPELFLLSKDKSKYDTFLLTLDTLARYKIEDKRLKLELMFTILVLYFKDIDDARAFITSLSDDKKFLEKILSMYKAYKQLNNFIVNDYNIQKLALHVRIDELNILASVTANSKIQDISDKILNRAKALHVSSKAPIKLLQGRNLIELGMKPSKSFSKLLELAFEAQLRGEFNTLEEAKSWLALNYQSL